MHHPCVEECRERQEYESENQHQDVVERGVQVGREKKKDDERNAGKQQYQEQ